MVIFYKQRCWSLGKWSNLSKVTQWWAETGPLSAEFPVCCTACTGTKTYSLSSLYICTHPLHDPFEWCEHSVCPIHTAASGISQCPHLDLSSMAQLRGPQGADPPQGLWRKCSSNWGRRDYITHWGYTSSYCLLLKWHLVLCDPVQCFQRLLNSPYLAAKSCDPKSRSLSN